MEKQGSGIKNYHAVLFFKPAITFRIFRYIKATLQKMPLPELKAFSLSRLAWHCISIGLFVFISCNLQQKTRINDVPVKKTKAISNPEKNTLAPPKVVFITSANPPKVIKAGRPIITIDSSNGGIPFFINYGTDQGLPINFITRSFQDNEGNVWLATGGGGVVKYDGKSFITYTTAQGLPDNFIECIMQDKAGNIWFGTLGNGISRYNGKTFTNFSTAEGLAGNLVVGIVEDDHGNLWFATDRGASRYDGKKFTSFTSSQGLAGNNIKSIMRDKAGNIWFGCSGSGLSRYDGKSFTNFTTADGLPGNTFRGLTQDRKGNIWICTMGSGVSVYDGKTFTNYSTNQGLPDNLVETVMEDKAGNIWFGTAGSGISLYNGKTFTTYSTKVGLVHNNILHIMQDKAGRVWFSTLGGLSLYDGKSVTYYNSSNGLAGNTVINIMQDRARRIWFACFGGGITSYDGKSFSSLDTAQGLIGNYALCIMQDKDSVIWIGTNNGASRYDGKVFTNYSAAQGLNASISSLIQDKKGNIWFGTNGNGIYRFDGKSFTNYTTEQGLCGNYVNSLMQDKNSDIWVGINGGISRYDGNSFTNYTTKEGLAANSAYCSIQDQAGNIWIGSGAAGASKYNGRNFINYSTADGLADDAVGAIAEDVKRNIIWFGTNQGFSGLKEKARKNKNDYVFDIFNNHTGYPIKNLNSNALIVDDKGNIWAGCENNLLIRFDYDAVNRDTIPMVLKIDNIKVNGETMCWNNLLKNSEKETRPDSLVLINEMVTGFGKVLPVQLLDSLRKRYYDIRFDSITPFTMVPLNLILPYEDNNLTIDFAAIEPDKPKQVIYQYMLEGYNRDWSPQGNATTAVFGNIPEGKYTFRLKALSPYGVWSQTSYSFKVLPPWWRTWWAYAIYILCFGAGVFLLGRILQQRLIKKERAIIKLQELEMHALRAQMNPHFIFNCLSSINRFVLMNETEAASDYLTKFSRLIRTVLNNSKKTLILLEDELEMLRLYLDMEKLRFKNGFNYTIIMDDQVEPQGIFIPPLLFQPFAENAVWHGLMHKKGKGQLIINLNVENKNTLNFVIEDDGVGRSAAAVSGSKSAEKNKSLGLQITKDRLSLINGYAPEKTFFEIEDLYDEQANAIGTRVLLKIKFRK